MGVTTRDELDAALEAIRLSATVMRVELDDHAVERMDERHVSLNDVVTAITGAHAVVESAAKQRSDWTVTGPDEDGDDLTLGVSLRLAGNVYVWTVFGR